jgi:hypothetical protein
MKRLLAFALVMLVSAPVLGGSCPMLVSQIDSRLEANGEIDAEARERVQELRDEGEAHHRAGRHVEAMHSLNEALRQLELEENG